MPKDSDFNVKIEKLQGVDIFYLSGSLDAHTAPVLENSLSKAISGGTNRIVINFEDLDYISSAGLGVFMAFIEDVRNFGGDIKLSNMKPKVFSVFDLLGFPMLFDIVDKQEKAIEKFNQTN
ncbi:MAG: STAS domain-containing protein [Candidatus Kapaibacterium sp.]